MGKLLWSVFIFMLLLSGCGWNGTPTREDDFSPVTSITISADYLTIAKGTSVKLKATGYISGLGTRDITDKVTWTSKTPSVATFSLNRVTGIGKGTAFLTATLGSVTSADYTLSVTPATISSIAVTPAAPSVPNGLPQQFKAVGTFSDNTAQDITLDAAWSSTATDIATISDDEGSKGLATTVAIGTSTITATFGTVSGTAEMTVTVPVLKSITLSPANPSILTLSTGKITATGIYTDNSTADVTSKVTWSSSDAAIATIVADGTITALTQGTATISATSLDGGVASQSTTLKTTGGNLTGINISPATVTLVKDISGRISATGNFSNGSIRDITGAVKWTPADPSLATVTTPGGTLAWLNPLTVTLVPTTITATSGTLSATASLSVISRQLSSIALSPLSLDLTAGTSGGPLSVSATFSDGTIQDVTTLSDWTSSDPAKTTIAASGLSERVTGVAAGTTTISAKYGGLTVPTPATVTVRSRSLLTLTISGASALTVGTPVPFSAVATYGDGTIVDVTRDATWSIDSPDVAIAADGANQPGQVIGVNNGSAVISVSFGGLPQTKAITVAGP